MSTIDKMPTAMLVSNIHLLKAKIERYRKEIERRNDSVRLCSFNACKNVQWSAEKGGDDDLCKKHNRQGINK